MIAGARSPLSRLLLAAALLAVASRARAGGGGGGGGGEGDARSTELEIDNESQYELREVRLHEEASYAGARNLLAAPLAIGATLSSRDAGPRYVTFFREKYAGGPVLAFTTANPIDLDPAYRYHVTILDQSFRVERTPVPVASSGEAGCACEHTRSGR